MCATRHSRSFCSDYNALRFHFFIPRSVTSFFINSESTPRVLIRNEDQQRNINDWTLQGHFKVNCTSSAEGFQGHFVLATRTITRTRIRGQPLTCKRPRNCHSPIFPPEILLTRAASLNSPADWTLRLTVYLLTLRIRISSARGDYLAILLSRSFRRKIFCLAQSSQASKKQSR